MARPSPFQVVHEKMGARFAEYDGWRLPKDYGDTAAERQALIQVAERRYFLDFAIYCASGQIDIETDGDTWHADPERIPLDNLRDTTWRRWAGGCCALTRSTSTRNWTRTACLRW